MNFPVRYDEDSPSGLVWADTSSNKKRIEGASAGSKRKDGYWNLTVRSTGQDLCHRVIWRLFYGPIPEGLTVDHANRDRGDNRIENLRLLTPAAQARNRAPGKSMRYTAKERSGRYRSNAWVKGVYYYFGTFDTEEQAHLAAIARRLELYWAI